tara:strand:+ start:145 stop:678 length:534 start_codon:yes stop_codon:yes gene_type:complete
MRFFPDWDDTNSNCVKGLIELGFDAYEHNSKPQIWVEIGCYKAEASTIFSSFPFVKKLWTVDPFIRPHPTIMEHAVERIDKIKKATLYRTTSYMFANKIKNKTLDLVYIDGDHEYQFVLEDLRMWNTRLKTNGLLCGHDYSERYPDVIKAVDYFMSENPSYTIKEYCDSSFMIKRCI